MRRASGLFLGPITVAGRSPCVPESIVRLDLAGGQPVRAADPSWDLTVYIRLYRSLSNSRPVGEQFWDIVRGEVR